ncbi:MAG: hypothetical protein Terrestrivirus4_168 [Terrestrivirus sp.]|jgi:hypothetical protein|uniref:Uncharacterized protein n=1 Tax=Terrestrivirus sp. TaxID=2487775 RepID=A0A3G4ZMP3_9VIRU|nr:MAG: hypothetical protein Terrestrivirus4_168 [Terrestrivirus sp.]
MLGANSDDSKLWHVVMIRRELNKSPSVSVASSHISKEEAEKSKPEDSGSTSYDVVKTGQWVYLV